MASFPTLKTGVVAQYPSDRTQRFSTHVHRFLDGSEQRIRGFGESLKRWGIRLELLDESELARVEEFFTDQGGRGGVFQFTDPWDGSTHENCSFESDALAATYQGAGDGSASVVIRENR